MKKIFIAATILLSAFQLNAQSFSQTRQITEQRIQEATQEFNQLQERIENERIPLQKQLDELENQAIRLRREASDLAARRDRREQSLIDLRETVETLKDNISYVGNLLRDYTDRFETQITYAEETLYKEQLREAREATDNEELSQTEKLMAQLQAVAVSLQRAEAVFGGDRFEGRAVVGEEGVERPGRFAVVGPVAYFASEGGEEAGLAKAETGTVLPVIYSSGVFNKDGIRSLVTEGEGEVPVDATLGEAEEFERVSYDLAGEIQRGGFVMIFILSLLGLAVLVAIVKFFQLMGVKRAKEQDLREVLDHIRKGDMDAAMGRAKKVGGPAGDMLAAGVEHAHEDREIVEEVLYERIIAAQPRLERGLAFIAVVAATAPLLGLLGTVTGMIKTFKIITVVGTGDAGSLSAGISEALITTKWGLITAIPTLILHALLSRQAKGVIGSMEQAAVGFVTGIDEMREDEEEAAE